MSFKQFALAGAGVFLVLGFGYISAGDLVKRKDKVEFQKIQLKSDSTKIKELDMQYNQLNHNLEKADEQRQQSAEELNKIKQQKDNLEKQKRDLEAQLQAKIEAKTKLAEASDKAIKAATMTRAATAAPAPAPQPQPKASGSVESIVRAAAVKHGVNPDYLVRVANCESTMGKNMVNRSYYAGGSHPTGLFQYLKETWNRISSRSPYGQQPWSEVMNNHTNAHVTAWAFANGYSGEWECA